MGYLENVLIQPLPGSRYRETTNPAGFGVKLRLTGLRTEQPDSPDRRSSIRPFRRGGKSPSHLQPYIRGLKGTVRLSSREGLRMRGPQRHSTTETTRNGHPP